MIRKFTFLFLILMAGVVVNGQPTNDNCNSATPITVPASGNICVSSTLNGATDDGFYNTCETAGSQEVWFTYIATGSTNTIAVSPTGATPAANLVVSVTSTNCSGNTISTCNAAATANGTATANWAYTPGTQVWVFVSSTTNSGGTFQICVTSVTPPPTTGKDCNTAAPLCNKNSFTAQVATGSNGFRPPCFAAALQQPIIFKFTVGQTGLLNWTATPTCGAPNAGQTEFDWAVYDITGGCPGTVVACDYNYTGSGFFGFPTTSPQGMQGGPAAGCNNTAVTGNTALEICQGVTVTAGNTYIIILDQYTLGSTCSINFNFTGSTFEMAPSSVFTITPSTGCGTVTATFNNTSVAASGATPYSWNFGDNTTSNAQNPPAKTYSTPGTYLVSLTTTSASGCTAVSSHPVQVFAPPTVSVNNASLCSGGSAALTATISPSVPGGTYSWSPGNYNTQTINVSPGATTTYTVTYTSPDNCTASATGTVSTGSSFTVNAGPDQVMCANQSQVINGTVTPAVGNYTYQWTSNPASTIGNANTLNPTISPVQNTTYTLAVTDAGGCSVTDNMLVNISGIAVPVTATANPSVICPGQLVQLDCNILPIHCGSSAPCVGNSITNSIAGGAVVQPGTALQPPTLFGNFLKSGRNQMLYTGPELQAALGPACVIKAVTFNIAVFNSNAFLQNFTIKMACTNATSLSTWEQNLTTVYTSASPYQPQAGWLNGIALTTPFAWDGTSGLIVDICWNNPATFGNQNNKAECSNTGANTYLYNFANTDQCGTATVPTASNIRPNVKFTYCSPNLNNYNILWTPNSGPNTVSDDTLQSPTTNPIATTTYNVLISDTGCAGSGVVTVTVDNSSVSAGPDKNSCPGATVNLNATVSGTIAPGPATFVWTTLAGTNVGNTQSVNVTPNVNTTYVVTMNGGACAHRDTINVTIGSLSPMATPTNVTCNGYNNGKIKATSASGTAPFSYLWSATAATGNVDSAINLAPNTYQVTVTDATGCSGSAQATITEPTLLQFSSTPVHNICYGGNTGSISIVPSGGTGAYTYTWSGTSFAGPNYTGLIAGLYVVTVRDANLCSATAAINITEPQQIVFLAPVIQNVRCFNGNTGSITVSTNGGTGTPTFNWSHNAFVHTATVTNLTAGCYTVTAIDQNLCSASANYCVTQPASGLTVAVTNVVNPSCYGYNDGSATVTPNGGVGTILYSWNPSNQTTQTAQNLSAQQYGVTVTDDSLCTASATVTPVNPPRILVDSNITNVSCNGGSDGAIDITVTNGVQPLTYSWSCNGAITQDVSGLPAGSCSVTVTDANSCSVIKSYSVNQPAALVLQAPVITDVDCFGQNTGSIKVNHTGGTGAITYQWGPTPGPNSDTDPNLLAGTYTVTLTDANNCSTTASYQVTEPATAVTFGNAVVVDLSCNGNPTGSITVSVSGGTVAGPYSYHWSHSNIINSPTASALSAGQFTVTATDDNGCTASQTNTVNQPSPITFGNSIITNVSCNGLSDGAIEVTPTGGTGGSGSYTYTWNGIAGPNPNTGLPAGPYLIVVTDANACAFSTRDTILEPAPIIVVPVPQDASCFGAPNGSADAGANGGVAPLTYLWNNNGTTAVIYNLPSGLYTVTVTDANGCSASGGANVNEPTAVIFNTQVTQVKCVGDQNGTITAFPSGGTPPYSYSATQDWAIFYSPTGPTIEGLASGYYAVIVNDDHGCTLVDTVFVPAPLGDTYTITTDSTSCFGSAYADGALHVFGLPFQNAPFQFAVDGGGLQYSGDFYNLKAGIHSVLAVNNFGCDTTLSAIVPEPVDATAEVLPSDTTLNLGESIQLASTFSPYPLSTITSYSWTPAIGLSCIDCPNPIATPYAKNTLYTLTITYNGHCTASASMTVLVEGAPPVYIPNSFSPNGDGNNDVFKIYGEGIKTISLKIFNRWGEMVYLSNNQFDGWDGSYKSVIQNPAVYVYEVEITYLNDKKTSRVGSITLLK